MEDVTSFIGIAALVVGVFWLVTAGASHVIGFLWPYMPVVGVLLVAFALSKAMMK